MLNLLDAATLILAGLMVGNELAIGLFVHPALTMQPDAVHAPAANVLARRLGQAMPLWYAAALLFIAADLYVRWHGTGHLPPLIVTAVVLWATVILFTVTALVPINNRIARMDALHPHPTWKQDRATWDRLHLIRIALLTLAFILLTTGILQSLR